MFAFGNDKKLPKLKSPNPDRGKKKKKKIPENKEVVSPLKAPMITPSNAKKTRKSSSDYIVISCNSSDWVFSQSVALCSVNVNSNGHTITSSTANYVNDNGNSWETSVVKKYYDTFIGGHNYYNHIQDPRESYGFIVNARCRDVKVANEIVSFVDVLMATNINKTPNESILKRILSKDINTSSMGCVSDVIKCSKCGALSEDDTDECVHMKFQLGNRYKSNYGDSVVAALISDESKSSNNGYLEFYEQSWVPNPAFRGAVAAYRLEVPKNTELFFKMPIKALERKEKVKNGMKVWLDRNEFKVVK